MPPIDTRTGAWAAQVAAFRRMTPAERVRLALEMSVELEAISEAGITARHPEYSLEDAQWAARRLRLGDELFRGAYPDAPVRDP